MMRITTTTGSVYRPAMSRELSIGELSENELMRRIDALLAEIPEENYSEEFQAWSLQLADLEAELEDRQSPRRSGW